MGGPTKTSLPMPLSTLPQSDVRVGLSLWITGNSPLRKLLQSTVLAAFVLAGFNLSAIAADGHKSDKPADDAGSSNGFHLPPLPADAHVSQSASVNGRSLKYTVTVGSLPVRDDKGTITGEVVFTAYTMGGKDRPVTFAVNGGPGASSVYLNFGAIGPKKVNFGVEGDTPSGPTPTTTSNTCHASCMTGWSRTAA